MSANLIVKVSKGHRNIMVASTSDPELAADLKVWAEEKGFRVEIEDHSHGVKQA